MLDQHFFREHTKPKWSNMPSGNTRPADATSSKRESGSSNSSSIPYTKIGQHLHVPPGVRRCHPHRGVRRRHVLKHRQDSLCRPDSPPYDVIPGYSDNIGSSSSKQLITSIFRRSLSCRINSRLEPMRPPLDGIKSVIDGTHHLVYRNAIHRLTAMHAVGQHPTPVPRLAKIGACRKPRIEGGAKPPHTTTARTPRAAAA